MLNKMKIDGIIDLSNNKISEEQFWDCFIKWVEDNNWNFGGCIEGIEINKKEVK